MLLLLSCEVKKMPRVRRRPRYSHLTMFERGRIVGLHEGGVSFREIGRRLNRNHSTVLRCWNAWIAEQAEARRPGSGASRKTTPRKDFLLKHLSMRHRFESATVVAQEWWTAIGRQTSLRTVYNRMESLGFRSYRPLLKLPLTLEHRTARLAWCRERERWQEEWKRIVFSDESRFCLWKHDGRIRVRRRGGERDDETCIARRHTAPTMGIMVWGAISYDSRSVLVRIQGTETAASYVEHILRPVMLPFLQGLENGIFQQDNARPHTAHHTRRFLTENNVPLLPWPARSPDLSPIEHVWDMIGRRLLRNPNPASTTDELFEQVNTAWTEIDQETIRTLIPLINSMPDRISECIRKRGGYTHY